MSGVLFLNGTVGAGKTTLAFAVADVLREHGIPHQVVDLDELRRAWPAPAGDPFNLRLELSNLAAVRANAQASGIRVLVLAGVIEDAAGRAEYEKIVGRMSIVRLTATPETLRRRLLARHEQGESRDWHLARAGELAAIISGADIDDHIVATDADTVVEIAARIAERFIAEPFITDIRREGG